MKFAKFDESKFPVVKVTFTNEQVSDEIFNQFLQDWINIYKKNKKFLYIFDTRNISASKLSIKYCRKLSKFINELKERNITLLQASIIIISNSCVEFLLKTLLSLSSPISHIYTTKLESNADIISIMISNSINNNLEINYENYNLQLTLLPIKYNYIKSNYLLNNKNNNNNNVKLEENNVPYSVIS